MNPFDQAWTLLKWQSPLRDVWGKRRWKSRFGTAYGGFGIPRVMRGEGDNSKLHATSLAPQYLSGREKALREHGPITHYQGTHEMDKIFGEDGGLKSSAITTDWNEANEWAQQRGKQMDADPGNVGVVGIRGQDLDFATHEGDIPQEKLVEFAYPRENWKGKNG